jgi:hypothetical protein
MYITNEHVLYQQATAIENVLQEMREKSGSEKWNHAKNVTETLSTITMDYRHKRYEPQYNSVEGNMMENLTKAYNWAKHNSFVAAEDHVKTAIKVYLIAKHKQNNS